MNTSMNLDIDWDCYFHSAYASERSKKIEPTTSKKIKTISTPKLRLQVYLSTSTTKTTVHQREKILAPKTRDGATTDSSSWINPREEMHQLLKLARIIVSTSRTPCSETRT